MTPELFHVVITYPDGTQEFVQRYIPAEQAVAEAHSWSHRPAAQLGIIHKVQITDMDDMTNFLWEYGKGVVYPPRAER